MGIVHIVMFAFEPLAPPEDVQSVSDVNSAISLAPHADTC